MAALFPTGMDDQKPHSRTFIVRLWTESSDESGEPLWWKGRVEDVEDRGPVYFSSLDDLIAYFVEQLEAMGARLSLLWRIRRRRLKSRRRSTTTPERNNN